MAKVIPRDPLLCLYPREVESRVSTLCGVDFRRHPERDLSALITSACRLPACAGSASL